jgi:hypothetical protein
VAAVIATVTRVGITAGTAIAADVEVGMSAAIADGRTPDIAIIGK